MLKLNSVVIAAILLVATGAMASNFRAADQVYVPAAGHVAGSSGTFISDIFISNLSTDTVSVSVILNQDTTGASVQNFNNVITLSPNERREILDFFPTVLGIQAGFGQLIFNACKMGGNCTPTCPGIDLNGNCPDFRNISVESRIYQIIANCAATYSSTVCMNSGTALATQPTTGQLFSGIPWYNFVSSAASSAGLDKAFITGVRNTGSVGAAGTYRGNIGLVNASQFSTTTLVVKLFDGKSNTQIGTSFTLTLGPLGRAQPSLSSMFGSFSGPTATNAYVTVEQTNTIPTTDAAAAGCMDGCPAFLTYGSVVDNQSGDATTLEAQFLQPLNQNAIFCIYNSQCKGTFTIKHAVRHQ
jgi:hypothetical protein